MRSGYSQPGVGRTAPTTRYSFMFIPCVVCVLIVAARTGNLFPRASAAVSPDVVISQVYGGGGNSGAQYANDFVELFNRGNATANFTNWAVQYASSTGAAWQKVDLSGALAPGRHFLVQLASGGANGSALPAPDATGTVVMAAAAGKVVLTNTNALIVSGVSCPSGSNVVDLLGYGSAANCFEGSGPTSTLSATTAAVRGGGGCAETDNNKADFTAGPVNPRNTSSAPAPCGAATGPTGVGAASPNPVAAGNIVLLTVTVTPGTNPASVGLEVVGDLKEIGGSAAQPLSDDGANGDGAAGDNVYSIRVQVAPGVLPGVKTLPIHVRDAQSRGGDLSVNLTVQAAPAPGNVVISQVYGGGGNGGAPFANDFIELFNRSASPVNISSWSAQYTSSTGASWQKVDLKGSLAPGQYYLIQLASGGANGALLPTADAAGNFSMAATAGKVALVSGSALLGAGCPTGAAVVDFVGYGAAANCFEGSGPAPAPASDKAIVRFGQGCADTNDNAANFLALAPAPKNTSSPFNVCGKGAKFENFSIKISGPGVCVGAGDVVTVEARFTNTGAGAQGDAAGPEFIGRLPAGLIPIEGPCAATAGSCAVTGGSQFEWNGAVKVNETIGVTLRARVKDGAGAGAPLCVDATLNFDSDGDGLNNAAAAARGCLDVNCAPDDPGAPFPAGPETSDQRPGSALIYPFYSSAPTGLQRENARIDLTNVDPARGVVAHLFFIEDDSASIADAFLCLTPSQTASFLASDLDPGVSGYLVVVAVDERTGCPINFNHLIGGEYVKLSSGHAGNLTAAAFAALTGAPPVCAEGATTAEIKFDGISYSAAPRALAIDSVPSVADGNSTLLVIDRIGGSLATGVSTIGQVVGFVYDDLERSASFEFNTSRRQLRSVISNTFPRTAPRITSVIPAGRAGWMKFWRSNEGAIIGCVLNYNQNATTDAPAFNQGRNLHALTLTADSSFTMPVFPPGC